MGVIIMKKNRIQFQKGMSIGDLMSKYGTDNKCQAEIFKLRWPNGFICPHCNNTTYCELKRHSLLQCNRCHTQTSVTSGTIFHSTKVPLNKWFLSMFLLTQSKNGISALELKRHLGVSYNTAWSIKHKLMQVMLERNNDKQLFGNIKIDDAYIGGEFTGGKRGRGSENKTPFITALEEDAENHPIRVKLDKIEAFKKADVEDWSRHHLKAGSTVVSDGLRCFLGIDKAGLHHEVKIVGSGKSSNEDSVFDWLNTILGNVKTALRGTYHAISAKHVPRYLAEFEYRFNRRFNLEDMVPRLTYSALRTPPMPMRFLTMAENAW